MDTLKKGLKDRQFLYKVEKELILFVKDISKESFQITDNCPYHRMLIHKMADYFQLEHGVDQAHTSVIMTKNLNVRLPEESLKDIIKKDQRETGNVPKKSILKRDSASLDDSPSSSFDKDKSPDNSLLNGGSSLSTDSSRSRSLEEREENYEKVRARIFNQDSNEANKVDDTVDTNDSKDSIAVDENDKLDVDVSGQTSTNEIDDVKQQQSVSSPPNGSQKNNCDTGSNDDNSKQSSHPSHITSNKLVEDQSNRTRSQYNKGRNYNRNKSYYHPSNDHQHHMAPQSFPPYYQQQQQSYRPSNRFPSLNNPNSTHHQQQQHRFPYRPNDHRFPSNHQKAFNPHNPRLQSSRPGGGSNFNRMSAPPPSIIEQQNSPYVMLYPTVVNHG